MAQTASVRTIFDDKPRGGFTGLWRVAAIRLPIGQESRLGQAEDARPSGIRPLKRRV